MELKWWKGPWSTEQKMEVNSRDTNRTHRVGLKCINSHWRSEAIIKVTLILIHYRWWSHNIRSGPDTNFYFPTSNFWQIYLFCCSSPSPPITRAYHHLVASCLRAERQSFSATTHKTPLNRAIISANCDQSFYYSSKIIFVPSKAMPHWQRAEKSVKSMLDSDNCFVISHSERKFKFFSLISILL